jgi:hypothetical protein
VHVDYFRATPVNPNLLRSTMKSVVAIRGIACSVAVGALLFASSSLAAAEAGEAPRWQKPPITQIVHSTRVTIEVELENGQLATEWRAEYAPAEEDGKAPPKGGAAWKVVDSGETTAASGGNPIYLGVFDPGEEGFAPRLLRHLTPDTSYYARFVAKNKDGEEVYEIPFKTLPAGKPEVPKGGTNEGGTVAFTGASSGGLTDTTAEFTAKIETNGLPTAYSFEYTTEPNVSVSWKLFTSGATGTVTFAEDYVKVKANISSLAPETTYYVRLKLTNEKGDVFQTKYSAGGGEGEVSFFKTLTAKPLAGLPVARNITVNSAFLATEVVPHGSLTRWRLESAAAEANGGAPPESSSVWAVVPGDEGIISQAQAEARPYSSAFLIGGRLTGLSRSTVYYVRLFAENECAVGCGHAASKIGRFETAGPPSVDTFAVHAIHGESLRLLGAVNPKSVPSSAEQTITIEGDPSGGTFTLTFAGYTTQQMAHDAPAEIVRQELESLPGGPHVEVEGLDGGPYRVFFAGSDGEKSQPEIEADGSGLTPSGTVVVAVAQPGGEAYDTHYRFQYVSQENHGWAGAAETPEEDAGTGETLEIEGADVTGLKADEVYEYRIVASSTIPGGSLVEGVGQGLVAPTPQAVGVVGTCPNEALRTGVSAHLPDCRAYEQVTPVDKEGAQEPFHYRFGISSAVLVGEDGEHAALEAPEVNYGSGAGAGQSPYFFSRGEERGWLMRAGAPQPETGVGNINPQLYNASLTQVAFAFEYSTSSSSKSPSVEYKIGPSSGPYTTVASVPREQRAEEDEEGEEGWAAANGDFSKLVLQSKDRTLLDESTGTKSGSDLYEYTARGGLVQLNVGESGSTIGSCGAKIVHGEEEGAAQHKLSGSHSISSDGSRVFFEAVSGHNCSERPDLYMRLSGAETVDLGAYTFIAANAQGTRVLLEDDTGKLVGYDTETATTESQSGAELTKAHEFALLGIPFKTEPQGPDVFSHPRYTFFSCSPGQAACPAGSVAGLPGGGIFKGGTFKGHVAGQVFRYDSSEDLVQCVSCASSNDPQPIQASFLNGIQGLPHINGGLPNYTAVSTDGDFAFFTTIAALVPQDIDLEIPAEVLNEDNGGAGPEYINVGGETSPSTDVYEWRRGGLDGCTQLQGCLALITDGRGGFLNLLLGTADEGRDVFIYTRSKLLPQDNDTSGDVYDVRVDGGLRGPPPRPVECEGDACSTPPSFPNDTTPSSLTFNGTGNVQPMKPAVKSKKHNVNKKAKKRAKARKRIKRHAKARGRSGKHSRGSRG